MADINNKNLHPVAVNYLSHPLTSEGAKSATVESGITISQALANVNYPVAEFDGLMVWVNGKPVEEYENYYVYPGDVVNVRPIVKGKNAGAIIAAVATIVISIYFPPAGAAMGMGQLTTAVVTAGLIFGATMLIYAAFPPPEPQEVERKESYLLASTRNRKRLFEALPLVIGKLRVAPDSASATFGRFENNKQTVNQVYHFGLQTGLTLEDWRIADTPLSDFSQAPVISLPDAQGNLPAQFNDTEVIRGAEVKNADGPLVVTTQPGSIGISIDVQAVAYDVGGEGNVKNRNMSFTFVVYDVATNNAVHDESLVISGNKINETRKTYETGPLPKAQYRVEITKTSIDRNTSSGQRSLTVVAIKSTQEDNTDYTNQLRVGLTVEASNQITGNIDQLTALAYDSIPVLENNSWTIKPTDNPAWWFLWFARGKRDGQGRLLYGGGLSDSQIDLEAIIKFAAWCDRKKLTCGMFVNKNQTVKKVLNKIARCGRGELTWGQGKLGVIWDDDQAVPVAVFSPSNIRTDTFTIDYNSNKTADEVIVNFLNKENDYKPDSVRVTVGNTVSPERPTQIQFEGCLDPDMAGREARLIAAAQTEMRRTISWETDIEGVVVKRGDVVRLSHDIVGWSESGRVVAGMDRLTFFIDKDIKFTNKGMIGIRTPDGKYQAFKVQSVNGRQVALSKEPPANFKMPGETNSPAADWLWFYDEGGKPGRLVKITDVQVKNRNTLSFTAKDYSRDYYDAETGPYVHKPKIDAPKPLGNLIPGVFAWETYRIDDDKRTQVLALSWLGLSAVNQYTVKIWNDNGGGEQTIVTDVAGARFDVIPGLYRYRISGTDSITGQIYSAVGSITITGSADVDQVKEFTAQGVLGAIILRWEYPDNAVNMRYVEIKATYNQGNQGRIENFREAWPVNTLTHDGLGVAQRVDYELVLVDSEGNRSKPTAVSGITSDNIQQIIDAVEGEIDESALAQDLKTRIDKIEDTETAVNNLKDTTDAGFKDVRNKLATAEQDLKSQLAQTNQEVSTLDGSITSINQELAEAKKEAQQGVTEAKAQISNVNTTLTQSVNDTKAEVEQNKKDLADAIMREAQANEQIKTELKQLIAVSGVQTFSQQTEPTGPNLKAGDVWFKEDADGNVINTYRYDGQTWQPGGAADAKANAAAILREQSARASADESLGKRIDLVSAGNADNAAAIRQQETALAQAKNALASRIDTIETTAGENKTAIQQEASARTSADVALGWRINTVTAKVGTAQAAINNEAKARASADEALTNSINSLKTTVGQNTAAISSEATARSDADTALGRRIDQVKTTSDQNTAAISSEQSARAAADGALGMRIDQVTATARANRRENQRLDAVIKDEQTARADADTALGKRVDTVSASVSNIETRFDNFDFNDGLNGWSSSSNGRDPISYKTSIANEIGQGDVLNADGTVWVYAKKLIKVDTSRKYKMRIKVRQVTAPTNGTERDRANLYAGFATFDYQKNVQTTSPGLHRYFVASKRTLSVDDGWQVFEGTITGEGNDSHSQFRENTAYVRPMFIINHNGGNGTAQVSKIEIWDATEELENAAEISSEKTARADADSALGQRIDTVSAKASDNAAKITQEATARADADKALTQSISTVKATAESAEKAATQNTAAIKDEQTARADADSALGQRIDVVSATLGKIEHTADNWDFERGTDGWTDWAETKTPKSTIPGTTKHEDGVGTVYSVNSLVRAYTKRAIPIIQDHTYRVVFKVRQKTPATSTGISKFYGGIAVLDSSYQRTNGNWNIYNAASAVNLQNVRDWKVYSAEFKGSDLPDGTQYIRPVFYGNYNEPNHSNGEFQVDYVMLEDITDQKRIETLVETEKTARANADSALGRRIDSLTSTVNNKADNTTVTALNERVATTESTLAGKASSTEVNTIKSSVETLFNNDAAGLSNSVIFNGNFALRNAFGRPAGWYATYSNVDPSTIGYFDESKNIASLGSTTDTSIGMASTAFALNQGSQYKIRIKVKAKKAASAGFYFRIYELDTDMPGDKKAIGPARAVSSVIEPTRQIANLKESAAITTSWETFEFDYTPRDTARFASAVFLNWIDLGDDNYLYIDFCEIVEVPAKAYVDAQINTVNETIANKDQAMAQRVNTVESNLSTTTKAANDAKSSAAAATAAAAKNRTDLTAKINQVESALTTKESALAKRISDLSTQVGNKANSSTVGALSKRVTQVETDVSGKASASEVNTIKATLDAVKDETRINGSNIFVDSQFSGSDLVSVVPAEAGIDTSTVNGDIPVATCGKFNTRDSYSAKKIQVSPGQKYFFSAMAVASQGVTDNFSVGLRYRKKDNSTLKWDSAVTFTPSRSWQKKTGELTVPNGAALAEIWIQYDTFGNQPPWYATDIVIKDMQAADVVENRVNAQITTLSQTVTTKDQARARQITQLESSVNSKTASIEQKLTTTANKVGGIESKYTVKIDNNGYIAGYGLIASENDGKPTSAFGVRADQFFVGGLAGDLDAKHPNYPFIVKNGHVYMRSAFIQDAAIDSAKIANIIQSTNYVAGKSGWRLDKRGFIDAHGASFRGTVEAQSIVGDIVSAKTKSSRPQTRSGSTGNSPLFGTVTVRNSRPFDRTMVISVGLNVRADFYRNDSIAAGRAIASSSVFGTSRSAKVWVETNNRPFAESTGIATITIKIPANKKGSINIYGHLDDLRGANRGSTTIFGLDGDPRSSSSANWLVQLFKDGGDIG